MFAPKKSVARAFSAFDKINTADEIKDVVKNNNLGIIIGKGQAFSDEEMLNVRDCLGYDVSESDVLLLIDTWLNDKMKAYEVDIVTNGADYNKIEENGREKRSTMYEMASNLDYPVIGVTHPSNLGSVDKILGGNTRWLTQSLGDGWGGHDGDVCNPTGATRTTIEFMSDASNVTLFVVSGGHTTAKELEVYHKMGIDIIMLNLNLDSPGEKMARMLGIEMDNLCDI